MLAGIDLGGTQVRVALARSDGRLVASIKTKTSLLGTPQGLVDWASSEIDRHRGREKGHPGADFSAGAPGGARHPGLAGEGPAVYRGSALIAPTNVTAPELFGTGGGASPPGPPAQPTMPEPLRPPPFTNPACRPRL